jgi:hypothetical protein
MVLQTIIKGLFEYKKKNYNITFEKTFFLTKVSQKTLSYY